MAVAFVKLVLFLVVKFFLKSKHQELTKANILKLKTQEQAKGDTNLLEKEKPKEKAKLAPAQKEGEKV